MELCNKFREYLLNARQLKRDGYIIKQAEQLGQLKERLAQTEMRIAKDAQSVNTTNTANAG